MAATCSGLATSTPLPENPRAAPFRHDVMMCFYAARTIIVLTTHQFLSRRLLSSSFAPFFRLYLTGLIICREIWPNGVQREASGKVRMLCAPIATRALRYAVVNIRDKPDVSGWNATWRILRSIVSVGIPLVGRITLAWR